MIAWVTTVSTSPNLNIEFSTGSARSARSARSALMLVENFVYAATNSEQPD